MKKRKSLKVALLFFMVICWFIPLLVLSFFMLTTYRTAYIDKVEGLIRGGLENTSQLVASRLDEGIRLMQKPSYERSWEEAWREYEKGELTKREYLNMVQESLKIRFYTDERFNTYAYYEKDDRVPSFYSSRTGYLHSDYMEMAQPVVERIMNTDSSYVEIHVADNQIYLIRNLYSVTGYERFGTFVVAVNAGKLLDGAPVEQMENVQLAFDGGKEAYRVKTPKDQAAKLYDRLYAGEGKYVPGRMRTLKEGRFLGYLYDRKCDNYRLGISYVVDKKYVYESLYELYSVMFVMFCAMIPVIAAGVHFLKRQIEEPVLKLVEASSTIQDGQIGTVVEGGPMPNQEFEHLVTCFNRMSLQVKHLFDSVYAETLARKDAQIAALQAQINPHFLNNTLEMMNWQARMNQDTEVSRMIEALGTVLDHSMNRDNKKVIYLSEELRCADAYLYIMSMRFGQRLTVEKEIDESLLWKQVPQLILQPLLENAIVHGIEQVKSGTIWLTAHHDETCIYLDVLNTGKAVSDKELERIRHIIAGKENMPKESRHTSIGIRNVHKRIRLVYGESYGLTIEKMQDDRICSRIRIPFVQEAQD